MKIKFLEDKKENKEFNIDNMFLSANNPRYSLIDNIDIDLKEFILSKNYKMENDVFINLLKTEGDFSDLCSLLFSILNNGFENSTDPIYFVKDNENNLIVAEGNRRLMCLKLIFSKFNLPKIWSEEIDFENNYDYEDANTEKHSIWDEDLIDNRKKREENYLKCEELINSLREKYKNSEFEVNVKISYDSNELWKLIYDKHLTGEHTGLRKWSRSKYFSDLLLIFKKGLNECDDNFWKKLYTKIRRDKKMIITDFKEAQYIYACFYFNNYDSIDNENINFGNWDDDILEKISKSSRISALERTHSYNKITNLICNEILRINKEEFEKEYIKILFDQNNKIKFQYKKLVPKKFLSFIFEKWKAKDITTRNFRDESIKNNIIDELSLMLKNVNKIDEEKTEEELFEINEFELTIDNLRKIISANQYKFPESSHVLNRFRTALEIKENNINFINKLKEKRKNYDLQLPINVFDILIKQLEHNLNTKTKDVFLNAICCSLRSLFEQVLIWFSYSIILENDKESINDFIKDISILRITKRINDLKQNKINSTYITKMLENNLLPSTDIKTKKELEEWIYKTLKDNTDENDKTWEKLNEFIHSNHRVYILEEYEKNIEKVNFFQEKIIKLIQNTNFQNKYMQEMNEKIIQYIRTKK